jgi:UDP-N-acetylmuramyl pentapeptide phosphotransferase/UDP-N-acetylglucosamine-1-phosphate transferase
MLSLLLVVVLLVGAQVLILPVVDTLSSSAQRCSLRRREMRA